MYCSEDRFTTTQCQVFYKNKASHHELECSSSFYHSGIFVAKTFTVAWARLNLTKQQQVFSFKPDTASESLLMFKHRGKGKWKEDVILALWATVGCCLYYNNNIDIYLNHLHDFVNPNMQFTISTVAYNIIMYTYS